MLRLPSCAAALALALLIGCGAQIQPADPEADAALDTGPLDSSPLDTGPTTPDAAAAPVTTHPPVADAGPGTGLGPLPYVVAIDVCPSAPGVDKIIFHVSEPLAPLPLPSPVHVTLAGTTCSDAFDSTVGATTYAWGSKCGSIDASQPITVTVTAKVRTAKGVELAPGAATFRPTRGPGKLCGHRYEP